ncbi:hypothetical protein Fot_15896 [Forsythia ovata]|uniref:Uncharacterized protein n=1 Tax=Forsythia ovata TaxID=205694 RepID=A0ABD1WD60_9LAMI
MAGFYFSRVPKLKIKSGEVVGEKENISPQLPVPCKASVPEVYVPQTSKTIVGASSTVPLASKIAVGILFVLPPEEPLLSSEDIRRSDKRKIVVDDDGETAVPRRGTEDDGEQWILERLSEVGRLFLGEPGNTLHFRGAARTPIPPPGWSEHINIKSRQYKLDHAILEKLSRSSAKAATSVHKCWISVGTRATEGAHPLEMIKMAEMNTAQSHVFNCELYKVFVMKVDELRSTVVGAEDINALRLENHILRSKLAIFEDARARTVYDVTKSGTIKRMCAQA